MTAKEARLEAERKIEVVEVIIILAMMMRMKMMMLIIIKMLPVFMKLFILG